MNKKRILRIAVFLAVTATVCAVALSFAVTPLINTKQVKARLTRILQDKTGIEVRFDQLAFFLDPLPSLSITDISAQIDQRNRITINSARVELDPAQLLKLNAAIKRIILQSPELIQNKDITQKNKSMSPADFVLSVKNRFDGLLDLSPTDTDHLDIIIANARSNYFDAMDCRVRITGRTRAAHIKAQISGFRLKTRSIPTLESVLKGRITEFEIPHLSVDCRHDENTFLAGNLKLTSLQAHLQTPKNHVIDAGEFDLKFALSEERITAHLAPLELVYPKGRVGMDLSLSPGHEASSIKFTGEQIDISQARQVCLPLLNGLETSQILFDILRAGTAQKITVGFKSQNINQLFNPENLFINGRAESATVKIPEVPVIVDNASGRAEMKDGILSIHPKTGHVKKTVITGGDLDINLVHQHTVPFSGKFPLKVDLAELPATLISILPDTTLAREMSNISGLTGRADAVLELNSIPTHRDLDVKVTAKNIQASGNYRRMPLPVRIDNGTFLLDKHEVVLKNMSGAIGNSRISNLNAGIDTRGSVPMNIKNMAANIILEQVVPLVDLLPGTREKLGPVKNLSGIMDIKDLRVEGPMFSPDLWQVYMTGQVNKGGVIFSDKTQGISDLFCTFNATPSTIKLSEITCAVKDAAWLEKNISPEYTQSIVLPLTLTRGQFVKQANACLFQGQLLTISGTKVFFMVDGPNIDQITPSEVQIEDGERTHADVAFYRKPDMPKLNFLGKLDKITLESMLRPDSFLHRKLQEVTGKNSLTVSTDKTGNITITADTLNIDPLLSPQKTSAAPVRPLVKQGQIFLNVDTLDYDQRVYQKVQAKVTINQPGTDIDITHARLCGLDFTGRITINHTGDNPEVLTHFFFNTDQAKEVSLSIGCLTGSQSVVEGSYTLKGEISGAAQTLAQVKSKQNGHLNFKAQSGRIYKATLLSRLLSILNILGDTDLQQQGFGFKTFTAEADVKESVMHIKKSFIDADNMAIIAEGWVDPLNDALDITFLVAPLKTIDTIIKYIPVVNTILNGRLISLPARAYGKISNPTVVLLHPSAVGKGLLTLFGDLVKSPGRLIEGMKNNEE
ncbi:AsmA-like C-terminal domain-containing protein [Desulfobacter curvatus]|uniref:AsmA-like C-terminal domain-containing protein n=1 Tax=Desulfobacter curvatus TaxID=2290 RepID=UPI0003782175|nr:AsmA-like C-terminal domain-containing protein [Desulfobacter curvatus]